MLIKMLYHAIIMVNIMREIPGISLNHAPMPYNQTGPILLGTTSTDLFFLAGRGEGNKDKKKKN